MGSNIAAVTAIIKHVTCLNKAKFTDKVNVEITLKKPYRKTKAILYYGTSGILQGRHELIGKN